MRMRNNHYRRKEEENKPMYLFGGREVSNQVCSLGATLDVWCSVAGATMVGATVVGAAAVGSAVIGAIEVGVTSGVLYNAVVSA